jgi:two-component sensor histidine kinase
VQQRGATATVDAATLVRELTEELCRSRAGAGLDLQISVEPITLSAEAAGPLAFIAGELVTGALRHAVPAQGARLSVSLRRGSDHDVELTVADNGRSMPDPADPRLLSGLYLARGLTAQLGGTLHMEENGLTRWVLRFAEASGATAPRTIP